jgi:hypothetical protein
MWSYTEDELAWLGHAAARRVTQRPVEGPAGPVAPVGPDTSTPDIQRLIEDPEGPRVWPSQHLARDRRAARRRG